jgi:hypothetical protein
MSASRGGEGTGNCHFPVLLVPLILTVTDVSWRMRAFRRARDERHTALWATPPRRSPSAVVTNITYCLVDNTSQPLSVRERHSSPAFCTCFLMPWANVREWHRTSHMHKMGDMSAPVGLNRASGVPGVDARPRLGTFRTLEPRFTVQPRDARDKQVTHRRLEYTLPS